LLRRGASGWQRAGDGRGVRVALRADAAGEGCATDGKTPHPPSRAPSPRCGGAKEEMIAGAAERQPPGKAGAPMCRWHRLWRWGGFVSATPFRVVIVTTTAAIRRLVKLYLVRSGYKTFEYCNGVRRRGSG